MLTDLGLTRISGEGLDAVGVLHTHELRQILGMKVQIKKVPGAGAAERMGRDAVPQTYLLAAPRQFVVDPSATDRPVSPLPEEKIPASSMHSFHVESDQLDALWGEQNGSIISAETKVQRRCFLGGETEIDSTQPACFADRTTRAVQNREDRIELDLRGVGSWKLYELHTFVGSWNGGCSHPATVERNGELALKGQQLALAADAATAASRRRYCTRFGNYVGYFTKFPAARERRSCPLVSDILWTGPEISYRNSTSKSFNDGRITEADSNTCNR